MINTRRVWRERLPHTCPQVDSGECVKVDWLLPVCIRTDTKTFYLFIYIFGQTLDFFMWYKRNCWTLVFSPHVDFLSADLMTLTSSCVLLALNQHRNTNNPAAGAPVSEGRDTSFTCHSAGLASGGQAGMSFNICVQFGYEIWTYIHLLFFLIVCFVFMHTDVFSLKVYRLLVQNQDISVNIQQKTLKDFGSVVIVVVMQDPVWWMCKTGSSGPRLQVSTG